MVYTAASWELLHLTKPLLTPGAGVKLLSCRTVSTYSRASI